MMHCSARDRENESNVKAKFDNDVIYGAANINGGGGERVPEFR